MHIAGRGIDLHVIEQRVIDHFYPLAGTRQTVVAAIHEVEVPVAGGEVVKSVVVLVVV